MNTSQLKPFAQNARRQLIELVSTKLSIVLDTNSAARRENEKAVKELEKEISRTSEDQVVEKVAYIWFNRFCALRFMDVNRYTSIGVVSPAQGLSQPEILMEAKQGHIDEGLRIDKNRVFGLLNETIPSPEPQQEAYRILLVAVCNDYYSTMPFLFERIADYTELLMPDDLLSDSSILTTTREALSEEACSDVEVIGWLYQFYISEKKDEVFAGLKKNKKVTPENIPAATQLFTPNWIVRYLVENSLGRLWMLNNPGSKLIDRMDYYIKPEQEEKDFLVIKSPEEIKICDPACGSGHMLVYAFEILYTIYEEQGYDAPKIPQLILENNLYGIEIDERAGELAAFALCMKAREKYRRFFKKKVHPNICVLENINFEAHEVKSYMDAVGPDLFSMDLSTLLYQFKEADNFGSLIRPELTNVSDVLRLIDEKKVADDMFLQGIHQRVLKVLKQADYLSPKYHVVVANPPYMGRKGMNSRLGKWVKDNYPNSKLDLFTMFLERCIQLSLKKGYMGMINLPSWLFLSSFAKLRKFILDNYVIDSMLHMGRGIFGIDWGSTAFVIKTAKEPNKLGFYYRLHKRNFQHIYYNDIAKIYLNSKNNTEYKYNFDLYRDETGVNEIPSESDDSGQRIRYRSSSSNFKSIPGTPITYWLSDNVRNIFKKLPNLSDISTSAVGQNTGDNDRFLKFWYEISKSKINYGCKIREDTYNDSFKWYPYNKGGGYRKWYGNLIYVVNWENDAEEIKKYAVQRNKGKHWSRYIQNLEWLFHEGITWSDVTSGRLSGRYLPPGFISDVSGHSAFFTKDVPFEIGLSVINSTFVFNIAKVLNPTIHFQAGNYRDIPYSNKLYNSATQSNIQQLIKIGVRDWNSYETSWDFTRSPLLTSNLKQSTLKKTYSTLKSCFNEDVMKMKELEEKNNIHFMESYGLVDEFKPELSMSEITLTCNPYYRYGGNKSEKELENVFLGDTIKEFLSYSVGCMFGRYSLDKEGLILKNQGETIENYLAKIPQAIFKPDDDNVIPIMEVDWFSDDIAERFKKFLRVTFGEEHYAENLEFIEKAIGKDIRKFFLKDFYTYHVKMYKKRPIYWMFSSPKGSFNALIYMHRYRPDTVSIVLNDYLREFRTKLSARKDNLEKISISTSASQGEKTKALKEIEQIKKVLDEVDEYERDILYPLATKQIEIDLDDGVKENYPKFGKALKKVIGLSEQ
ncbi:BREX-1 system adenine-specific DNA-methyltransferase PglX [Desulfobacter latus]|uniref:site-specific DNA-methyltransferase (adenine-specific) n=1 Tax=Desulfobacter latus TaxID=2292 RepID=A0A850SQ90_9BACT|nr:BREX-1 system adenine-specific DNA-methyltransferase PglX [Desulfobacter latus]NWH03634.1 BREX-1 system adenine-specific DNA-methyltransferase PglX [Desulfobacter latus]